MDKERKDLSQERPEIADLEQSKLMEDNKQLLRVFGSIFDKADGYARLNELTNSGLSIIQALQKILEENNG